MTYPEHAKRESGFSMIEVLVTLIILLVGLLGLAGLMMQSQRSEMESYQRVQALVLLQDMLGRINANRNVARCYAFTTNLINGTPFVGVSGTGLLTPLPPGCSTGTSSPTPSQLAQFNNDIVAWNTLLNGAAEAGSGGPSGAMIGARGCISYDVNSELPELDSITGLPTGNIKAGTGIFTLSIAWQGLGDTFAPTGLTCGKGLYGAETKRRVVSLTFRIASMQ